MEILNTILLIWAWIIIIFQVFFINFLQKMLKKEQEQKFEILLYFSKNYENLFERCIDFGKDLEKLKNEALFLEKIYESKK